MMSLFTVSSLRADDIVLPGVARANGVGGSRFVSTVWLHNPSDASLPVQLGLVTPGGAASAAPLTLAPRETRRLDDPVGALFGLDSGAGSLTASAPGELLVRGVTANVADPKGTYGLALSAIPSSDALMPGETGTAGWLSHTTAAGTGFRTNVAVTLLAPGSDAVVTVLDDTGLVRGEERLSSAAPLFWQRSVGDLCADAEIPLGRVEVRVLAGAAVAYTAVVDNVTGDGVLAMARRLDRAAGALLVPGAARTPGANGTLWRTGLRVVNPSLAPVDVALDGVGVAGAPHAVQTVAPNGVLEESDLLGALGLAEGSAGAVRVSAAAPLAALAVTRDVDPSGRPGTFAASEELVAPDGFVGPGRTILFTGLSADPGSGGFRTNVAFVGGSPGASGTLRLRAPGGNVAASAPFSVGASSWVQRPLADWLGGAAVPRDATLEVGVASGALTAYASVVDNGTGDPVVLAPASVVSGGCPPAGAAALSAATSPLVAGTATEIRLDAPGRGVGRLVPGDAALGDGGSVTVSPSVTTTYRWYSSTCPLDAGGPLTVVVTPPAGAVMTGQGSVRGVAASGAVSYKGIPFAAPPTGPMRWRPPAAAPLVPGVLDASGFGDECAQLDDLGRVVGSEDCLTLNVYAPLSTPAAPLPVMFFIHGGGNVQGASSIGYYDGTTTASKGRAVVVTANYRLSSFGWLVQPWLSTESRRGVSGNYGAFDQLAALRWVKRNIAAFGGDPERVMIFGESAGGVNVCTLVSSPLGKGLFARALVESGGCIQKTQADYSAFGDTITSAAGCSGAADPAACMRTLGADQLLKALPPHVDITTGTGQLWGPNVDGLLLTASPHVALASGSPVPFAIGANADETGEAAALITTDAQYQALLAAQFGALAPVVLAKYPSSAYGSPRKAWAAVTTDSRFVCPARHYAATAAAGGPQKVFRYFFSYPANKLFGAIHGSELPFVFGTFSAIPGYTPDPAALALSDAMNASWARFAATGDPNGAGLAAWPAYDAAADLTMVWNDPPAAMTGVRAAQCDFWDSLTFR